MKMMKRIIMIRRRRIMMMMRRKIKMMRMRIMPILIIKISGLMWMGMFKIVLGIWITGMSTLILGFLNEWMDKDID